MSPVDTAHKNHHELPELPKPTWRAVGGSLQARLRGLWLMNHGLGTFRPRFRFVSQFVPISGVCVPVSVSLFLAECFKITQKLAAWQLKSADIKMNYMPPNYFHYLAKYRLGRTLELRSLGDFSKTDNIQFSQVLEEKASLRQASASVIQITLLNLRPEATKSTCLCHSQS